MLKYLDIIQVFSCVCAYVRFLRTELFVFRCHTPDGRQFFSVFFFPGEYINTQQWLTFQGRLEACEICLRVIFLC